jgi:enamine deaminase RidA (YjgF/YER057c/UK114 family)
LRPYDYAKGCGATDSGGGAPAHEMCMAVRAGNRIFLRGQTGFDLEHNFVGRGDAAAQADQAMKNVKVLLEEAGGTVEDICKITLYITDRAYREPVYNIVGRYLRGVFPCGTGIIVSGLALPEMLVELEIEAVIAEGVPGDSREDHDRLRRFSVKDWFKHDIDWDGSMVVRTEDEIFVRGQTGSDLDGSRVHGIGRTAEDAATQAEFAMTNLKTLLEEAGSSLDDICKINVYIDDRAHRVPVYRTMGRHLRGVHPVSTGLIVAGFARPEILFELDAVVVPQRGGKHTQLRKYHSDNTKYGVQRQKIDCEFCQVVQAGKRIFLRGQVGQNLEDSLTSLGDAGTQAAQAMRNVETLLGEAGSSLSDICRVVLYVTDRFHLAAARESVLRHLAGVSCAMSEVIVKGLASPDLAMEVDVFAVQS